MLQTNRYFDARYPYAKKEKKKKKKKKKKKPLRIPTLRYTTTAYRISFRELLRDRSDDDGQAAVVVSFRIAVIHVGQVTARIELCCIRRRGKLGRDVTDALSFFLFFIDERR